MKAICYYVAFCCCFLASVPALAVAANNKARVPSAGQWRQDLAFFQNKLIILHPNPFRKNAQSKFEAAARQLDASFGSISREQTIVGFMRLVASLGDGHTTILPGPQTGAGFHLLPLRFYVYGNDLYLDGADRAYSSGLGGKLVSIHNIPAAEIVRRLETVTPGDNSFSVKGRLPSYLVVPEILTGLNVISDILSPVSIALDVGGRRVTLRVRPIISPADRMGLKLNSAYTDDWVDRGPAEPPLWLRHASKPYWFQYQTGIDTLYIQYNDSASDPNDPMPAFARRLDEELRTRRPKRVVFDLRLNMGGDGYWNRFLLLPLIRSEAARTKGKFFVLIGRQTFSAGSMTAVELEKYTSAIFIGEPTGGSIQGFGNHEFLLLPNSGLGVMIATAYYQNDGPKDDRPWIAPERASEITPAAYRSGQDPALEAALRYEPTGEMLKKRLLQVPPEKAAFEFAQFKADPALRYVETETLLIAIGYDLIKGKDFSRAVETMKLAVGDHPTSANAYDSLGDAYRAAGQRDQAVESYRQALRIDPNWSPSVRSLHEMSANR